VQGRRWRKSGVGERFAGARAVIQFAHFEDFATIEALDILRFVIFSDELRVFVLASGVWHHHTAKSKNDYTSRPINFGNKAHWHMQIGKD